MILFRIYAMAAVVAIAITSTVVLRHSRKKTPEERERLRREYINTQGRITDGTVIDVQEYDSDTYHSVQMVIYSYDVAGVQYECSQDVTYLRQFLDLHSCRIGVNTSVKYDPQNPGNSIVVAENWCGLRL